MSVLPSTASGVIPSGQSSRAYTIIKRIGEGSFGTASLATHIRSGASVVIKTVSLAGLNALDVEAARREAVTLQALTHPNIIGCIEAFSEGSNLMIVTDFADCGDLAKFIERRKGIALSEGKLLMFFTQICLALAYMHRRRTLHRDLKLANVFLASDGADTAAGAPPAIRVGDLGIARSLVNTMELAKTVVGTPYYLAPEICENRPYSHKADVWAAGCCLYELATFRHPFEGSSLESLVRRILRGEYTSIASTYTQNVKDVIAMMLNLKPGARPSFLTILKLPFLRPYVLASSKKCIERGRTLPMLEEILPPESPQVSLSEAIPPQKRASNSTNTAGVPGVVPTLLRPSSSGALAVPSQQQQQQQQQQPPPPPVRPSLPPSTLPPTPPPPPSSRPSSATGAGVVVQRPISAGTGTAAVVIPSQAPPSSLSRPSSSSGMLSVAGAAVVIIPPQGQAPSPPLLPLPVARPSSSSGILTVAATPTTSLATPNISQQQPQQPQQKPTSSTSSTRSQSVSDNIIRPSPTSVVPSLSRPSNSTASVSNSDQKFPAQPPPRRDSIPVTAVSNNRPMTSTVKTTTTATTAVNVATVPTTNTTTSSSSSSSSSSVLSNPAPTSTTVTTTAAKRRDSVTTLQVPMAQPPSTTAATTAATVTPPQSFGEINAVAVAADKELHRLADALLPHGLRDPLGYAKAAGATVARVLRLSTSNGEDNGGGKEMDDTKTSETGGEEEAQWLDVGGEGNTSEVTSSMLHKTLSPLQSRGGSGGGVFNKLSVAEAGDERDPLP